MSIIEQKWEMKMNEAKKLRKKGAELLFKRVSLLIECYLDAEFLAWCEENRTNEIDFLDNELEDTACDFLTLKAVMEAFPTVESWRKHNLRDMIADCLVATKKEKRPATRPTLREIIADLKAECERLRGENHLLREMLAARGVEFGVLAK